MGLIHFSPPLTQFEKYIWRRGWKANGCKQIFIWHKKGGSERERDVREKVWTKLNFFLASISKYVTNSAFVILNIYHICVNQYLKVFGKAFLDFWIALQIRLSFICALPKLNTMPLPQLLFRQQIWVREHSTPFQTVLQLNTQLIDIQNFNHHLCCVQLYSPPNLVGK